MLKDFAVDVFNKPVNTSNLRLEMSANIDYSLLKQSLERAKKYGSSQINENSSFHSGGAYSASSCDWFEQKHTDEEMEEFLRCAKGYQFCQIKWSIYRPSDQYHTNYVGIGFKEQARHWWAQHLTSYRGVKYHIFTLKSIEILSFKEAVTSRHIERIYKKPYRIGDDSIWCQWILNDWIGDKPKDEWINHPHTIEMLKQFDEMFAAASSAMEAG